MQSQTQPPLPPLLPNILKDILQHLAIFHKQYVHYQYNDTNNQVMEYAFVLKAKRQTKTKQNGKHSTRPSDPSQSHPETQSCFFSLQLVKITPRMEPNIAAMYKSDWSGGRSG